MGVGYYNNVVQWSKGEYEGANNQEDDLAIIASQLNYRPDDCGDTMASATKLSLLGDLNHFETSGMINRPGDKDMFFFEAGKRRITAHVTVLKHQASNLDAKLKLLDSNGDVVAASNPRDRLAAWLSYDSNNACPPSHPLSLSRIAAPVPTS